MEWTDMLTVEVTEQDLLADLDPGSLVTVADLDPRGLVAWADPDPERDR